jgi:hypothetical protein
MDGRQRRIGRVERTYECSRLESQLLADAYRRVLPPKQFRLAQRGLQEATKNLLPGRPVSESATRSLINVNGTESPLTMEGAVA